jgi:transcriptional regulator with XRE-family HTH domain
MPMMKRKRAKLSGQIRRAVDACGLSRYRICKETGIDQGAFSRFMAGKVGLTMAHLDAVADVLGLDVVARGPVKVSPNQKPGRKPKRKRGKRT